ncbi:MAG TPA: hypothetical protein VFX30_00780 [bacterium]|nr:hypothetical protein [bacterium]
MKGLFLRLEDQLDRDLNEVCRREGYKKSGLITKLIRDFIRSADKPRDPVREAQDFGIDISLIDENLKKTPTQRLRDAEQAAAFVEALRRAKRFKSHDQV